MKRASVLITAVAFAAISFAALYYLFASTAKYPCETLNAKCDKHYTEIMDRLIIEMGRTNSLEEEVIMLRAQVSHLLGRVAAIQSRLPVKAITTTPQKGIEKIWTKQDH
jgi:hypothetical protein